MSAQRQAGPAAARARGVPRRRTLLALIAATWCLGLPLLASCATNPAANPEANSAADSGNGNISGQPLLLTLSDSDPRLIRTNAEMGGASLQALLTGTLSVGRGNCLGVATDKGTVVPAFPRTAVQLAGGRPGIEIQDHQYLVGEQVSFGGGLTVLGEKEKRALAPCLRESDTDIFLIESFGP